MSDSRRWVWALLAALVIAACGDQKAKPAAAALPPRVTLTAPVSTGPGATVSAHVDIGGDASGSELVIRATQPGPSLIADLPRFVEPGVSPPTGAMVFLAPDGTWSARDVAFASGPSTADLSFAWPTATVGQWQLTATLREAASQLTEATDQANVLVAQGPALALSIDRLWLGLADLQRVSVQVAGSPSSARLVSWLTLPDGSQLALPYLTPYLPPSATLGTTSEVTLLDRDLASLGAGDYQVSSRLIDPTTGTILAAGGAGFTVCATPGTISGTVRDSAGGALGASASDAYVQLVSLQRGGGTAQVTIDASGHYEATVPVGRWQIEATVVDAAGTHQVAQLPVTIGCGAPTQLDLAAAAPVTRLDQGAPPAPRHRTILAAPASPPGCTPDPVVVLVKPDYSPVGTNKMVTDTELVRIVPGLRGLAPPEDIKFTASLELEAALGHAAQQMALGCDVCTGDDMRIVLDVAHTLQSVDFILRVNVTEAKMGKFNINFTVDDVVTDNVVTNTFAQATMANLDAQVDKAINDLSAGLVRELRGRSRSIKYPNFTMSTDPRQPRLNDPFTVSTVVTDSSTCAAAPARTPLTLTEVANNPPVIPPTPLTTDAQGIASSSVTVASAPIATFKVTFDDGTHHAEQALVVPFKTAGIDGMSVGADRVTLAFGERAHGVIDYPGHASTALTLTASNGSVDPPAVMTDANGHAEFTYTAGSSGGIGAVHVVVGTARLDGDIGVTGLMGNEEDADFWIEAPLKISVDAAPTPSVLVQQQLPITATVQLANGDPAVGQPILFTITSGLGVISHATVTTDDKGLAAVVFTAPTMAGTTTIEASGAIGTARVASSIDIEIRDPCVNCPVVITTDMDTSFGPHVPKGGTAKFMANQIVSWSVNLGGGSIDSSGHYTGGASGGIYTVTATSLENVGQTGTFDFTVDCDEAELGSAHATSTMDPVLGGGTSYTINQTAGIGDACTSSGSSTLRLYAPAYWDMTTSQGFKHVDIGLPGVCSTLVSDSTHPPTLQGCSINYHLNDNVSGCPLVIANVIVSRGPGIGGLTGHYEKHQGDATCTTLESVDFATP